MYKCASSSVRDSIFVFRKERDEFIRLKYVEHHFVHPHKSRSPSNVLAPHTPTPYDQTSGESDVEPEPREPTPTPSITSITSVPANFHFSPTHMRSRSQTLDTHSKPKLHVQSLKKSVWKYAKKKNPFKSHGQDHQAAGSDEEDSIPSSVVDPVSGHGKSSQPGKSSKHALKSWGLTMSLSSLRLSNKAKAVSKNPLDPPPEPPPKPPRTHKRVRSMEKDPLNDQETAEPLLKSEESSMSFNCELKDFLEEFDRRLGENRSASVGDLTRVEQTVEGKSQQEPPPLKPKPSISPKIYRAGSFPNSPKLSISVRESKSANTSPVCPKKSSHAPILSDLLNKSSSPHQKISLPTLTTPSKDFYKGPLKATPDSSPQLGSASGKHDNIRAARKLSDIESDSSSSKEELGRISVGDVSIGQVSTDGQESSKLNDLQRDIQIDVPNGPLIKDSDSSINEVIGSPTHSEMSTEDRPLPDEPVIMPYDLSPDLVSVCVCVCVCVCVPLTRWSCSPLHSICTIVLEVVISLVCCVPWLMEPTSISSTMRIFVATRSYKPSTVGVSVLQNFCFSMVFAPTFVTVTGKASSTTVCSQQLLNISSSS